MDQVNHRVRMPRSWWTVAVVLVTAVGCAGTATSERGPSSSPGRSSVVVTPPAPEPDIHLSLIQQGVDEGSPRVRVRVENVTDRDLSVRDVGLNWPGYGRTTSSSPYLVGAGAIMLESHTVRRAVDDMGVRFAQRWWRTRSALRRVRSAARLSYGGPWRVTGAGHQARLETSLRVVRRAGAPRLTLAATQGTVLFDLELYGAPSLAPEQEFGELPLAVTPGRCDEHARSQASQPFTFRLNLQLDDDPQLLPVVVRPGAAQQRSLLDFLDKACAQADD